MLLSFLILTIVSVYIPLASSQTDESDERCPLHWVQYRDSCYRFVKSPLKSRIDAQQNCKSLEADLANINDADEHGFIMYQLLWQDPQRRRWYFAGSQKSPNLWQNEDGTNLNDLEAAFLPEPADSVQRDYLAYSFSDSLKRWGFERVTGSELLLYICETPMQKLRYLLNDDRSYTYGMDIENPDKIPRGPFFIKQPRDVVFDLSKRSILNDISVSCYAGGYPNPYYEWFKEDYVYDRLVANLIDPLSDSRFTISGGDLIIHDPRQIEDRGSYHCKATNVHGSIISESVQLSFGFIGEFNLKRAPETGNQNWGKAMFCDPPINYPGVNYYWARDYFPNFVEEDKRVFVSYDGALYFSALEHIDAGNYSCNVQSKVSDTGRNGPFFELKVNPHSNFQQLKFPNNFPKTFPEAPKAGDEVRLECVAFGYPVPSYNWTRRGSHLPKNAYGLNYNRVLVIPDVKVEDQGEYLCRASNDRSALESSVTISIQAEPNFTIPLTDRHMDNEADLTWTCEAFGIPDVTYNWFRNGEMLNADTLAVEDQSRYFIQDNVLTIRFLNAERDQAMYQCRARNQLKTRYSSAQLRVLTLKPSFKKKPLESETYAGEGGNVTIYCNPEAAPRPKFVWKKDGNILGSGGRRKILDNGNLIISPVSRDDSGTYSCSAFNAHGSDESKGRLIVLLGPSFYETLPPKMTIAVEHDLQLRCHAQTEELLDVAYIWTHNGLRIGNMDLNELETPNLQIDGGLLQIRNASFSDAGEYECTVKSTVGKISTKTNVIVEGPPGLPGGVQVVDVQKTSAVVQWTDGASNGRPITHYRIIARTNWNSTWFSVGEHVTAKEVDRYTGRKETGVENVLVPWSTYEFKVVAGNDLGYGPASAPSPQFNTPADKPYVAPSRIGGGGGKIGDLTISWLPLSREKQNAPNVYYKIFWRRKHHDTEFQSQSLKEYGNVGVAVVRISLEFFYTEYEVKVQAINDVGVSPESEVVTIFSAEDMPQVAPQGVYSKGFNGTAINVTWNPIDLTREKIRGKLIGHRIKYWKRDFAEETAVYYLSRTTRNWALIVGLQPDTYYYVKVMAYNNAGEGPESERFLERTYRKAPQKPPSAVHVKGVNPTTVHVTWRYVSPSLEEEPVIGYKVRVWEVDQDMSRANDTFVKVGETLNVDIVDLSPGKRYHLRVLAYSNGGDGRMSSPAITFQMGEEKDFKSTSSSLYSVGTNFLLIFCSVLYLMVAITT